MDFERKSWKSENRFYVPIFNFWSRADIKNLYGLFKVFGTRKKVGKNVHQKITSATWIRAQTLPKSGIFHFFRKSGYGLCLNDEKIGKN